VIAGEQADRVARQIAREQHVAAMEQRARRDQRGACLEHPASHVHSRVAVEVALGRRLPIGPSRAATGAKVHVAADRARRKRTSGLGRCAGTEIVRGGARERRRDLDPHLEPLWVIDRDEPDRPQRAKCQPMLAHRRPQRGPSLVTHPRLERREDRCGGELGIRAELEQERRIPGDFFAVEPQHDRRAGCRSRTLERARVLGRVGVRDHGRRVRRDDDQGERYGW
jgi:hypothetical protein